MRPWSEELVERALAAIEGWGGLEALRRDRAQRASRLHDPYLVWALPHVEGLVILGLTEGRRNLPRERWGDYIRLYKAAIEAGIAVPEEAKTAVRRFREEVER